MVLWKEGVSNSNKCSTVTNAMKPSKQSKDESAHCIWGFGNHGDSSVERGRTRPAEE